MRTHIHLIIRAAQREKESIKLDREKEAPRDLDAQKRVALSQSEVRQITEDSRINDS